MPFLAGVDQTIIGRPRLLRTSVTFAHGDGVTCRTGDVKQAFLCGNPALDLACMLRARRTERLETLDTPDRLGVRYRESGIVDALDPCEET
jgi:hypothetical protein